MTQSYGPKPINNKGKVKSALYLNGLNYLIMNSFVNFISEEEELHELTIDFWFKVDKMSKGYILPQICKKCFE